MVNTIMGMNVNSTYLIDEFLTNRQDVFTLDDFSHYLKQNGVKVPKSSLNDILLSSDMVFSLVGNEFVTRAGVFTGRWFSFKPTKEEIDKGHIILGHRCIPFVNPEVAPDLLYVANKKEIVKSESCVFSMNLAMDVFALFGEGYVIPVVTPVLEGNIREIISQIKLKDLIQGDKKVLSEKVVENVKPNLFDLGLELTTFNIQNFKDDNGVINNLGIENTVAISKDAAKAKAAAEAEVKIAQAQADKDANDARVAAELEIAQKQTDLAVKRASLQLQADTEAAKAEAAKGIETENQRKVLEIKAADANIAKQEKQIEIQEKAVSIKERALDAEVKKTAEAEKFAAQQKADADLYTRQKKAEAEAFEIQRQAEAEAFTRQKKAEAEKIAMENEALGKKALAEAIQAQGEAEAAAVKAKLVAEADGMREKAEALKEYGDAARQQMQLDALKVYFEQLPKIAEASGKAYQNVDTPGIYLTLMFDRYPQEYSDFYESMLVRMGLDNSDAKRLIQSAYEFEKNYNFALYEEKSRKGKFASWNNLDKEIKNFPVRIFLESCGVPLLQYGICPEALVFDSLYLEENLEAIKTLCVCRLIQFSSNLLDMKSFNSLKQLNEKLNGKELTYTDERYPC